ATSASGGRPCCWRRRPATASPRSRGPDPRRPRPRPQAGAARGADGDGSGGPLIEIDENLPPAELTQLPPAPHVAERKRVWQALRPEMKRGGLGAKQDSRTGKLKGGRKKPESADSALSGNGRPAPSFVEATAVQDPETGKIKGKKPKSADSALFGANG